MKKIEVYKTDDGKIFEKFGRACFHEKMLRLEQWYEDNKLPGTYEGCRIEWENFRDWFLENRNVLREVLRENEDEEH